MYKCLSALKWDCRCFLLLAFLTSVLSCCCQCWLFVPNADPSSLMLASCLQCWTLFSNVDPLSSILTPCLECWPLSSLLTLVSNINQLPFILTRWLQCWPIVFHFDPLSPMVTPCLSLCFLVSSVDPCLPCWLLASDIDPLPFMLTPFFNVDPLFFILTLASNFDPLSSMLAPCLQCWLLVSNVFLGDGRRCGEAATTNASKTRGETKKARRATVRGGHGRLNCDDGGETVCTHKGKDHVETGRRQGYGKAKTHTCGTAICCPIRWGWRGAHVKETPLLTGRSTPALLLFRSYHCCIMKVYNSRASGCFSSTASDNMHCRPTRK